MIRMVRFALLGLLLLAAATANSAPSPSASASRLLLVTVTKGFRHDSIVDLARLLTDVGAESGLYTLDRAATDDELATKTSPAALAGYAGIVFASTTGDLPVADRAALVQWIEDGHALVGLHAATDTFHGYGPFLDLLGGEFDRHGPQAKVRVIVRDPKHPATRGLEPAFHVFDEIYQFKRYDPARVHLILGLDAHPETGAPGKYPLAWTREQGKGRVFYTGLGHRPDVIAAPWYRAHVRGGIEWALGRGTGR
jgi:type 1 glutamine amidotransferase